MVTKRETSKNSPECDKGEHARGSEWIVHPCNPAQLQGDAASETGNRSREHGQENDTNTLRTAKGGLAICTIGSMTMREQTW